jgi:hemin uptake protein HemP
MPHSDESSPLYVREPRTAPHAAREDSNSPAIESAALLRGACRIAIRHGGKLYWLRATRQGKLLLTK